MGVLGRAGSRRRAPAFAGLVTPDEDEIAVTTSVSAGVSALASGLRFGDGRDTIVVTDFEFPTIGQIWHAQEPRGARVVHVPAEAAATSRSRPSTRRSTSGRRWSPSRRLLPERRRGSTSQRIVRHRARARRARAARRLPGGRLAADRRARARRRLPRRRRRSSTCSARPGSASSTPPRAARADRGRRRRAGSRTATSSRWASTTTRRRRRPALRVGHAARPVDLRGRSPGSS